VGVSKLHELSGQNDAFGSCRIGVGAARLQVLSGLKGALGTVELEWAWLIYR
jgi:hypothetical protein